MLTFCIMLGIVIQFEQNYVIDRHVLLVEPLMARVILHLVAFVTVVRGNHVAADEVFGIY